MTSHFFSFLFIAVCVMGAEPHDFQGFSKGCSIHNTHGKILVTKIINGEERNMALLSPGRMGGVLFAEQEGASKVCEDLYVELKKMPAFAIYLTLRREYAQPFVWVTCLSAKLCKQGTFAALSALRDEYLDVQVFSFLPEGLLIQRVEQCNQRLVTLLRIGRSVFDEVSKTLMGVDWASDTKKVVALDICRSCEFEAQVYYAIKEIVGLDTNIKLGFVFSFVQNHCDHDNDCEGGTCLLRYSPVERLLYSLWEIICKKSGKALNAAEKMQWRARVCQDIFCFQGVEISGLKGRVLVHGDGGLLDRYEPYVHDLPSDVVVFFGVMPPGGLFCSTGELLSAQYALWRVARRAGKSWCFWHSETDKALKCGTSFVAAAVPVGVAAESVEKVKHELRRWICKSLPGVKENKVLLIDRYRDLAIDPPAADALIPLGDTVEGYQPCGLGLRAWWS